MQRRVKISGQVLRRRGHPPFPLLRPAGFYGFELASSEGKAYRQGGQEKRQGPTPPSRQRCQAGRGSRNREPRGNNPYGGGLPQPFGSHSPSDQYHEDPQTTAITQDQHPWRLKEMTPGAVGERLLQRASLIVPVGTTEQHGPHLPLGCDTIIVERLADDLSEAFGIPRTPTVEYGVHAAVRPFPGGAALRRRTLHRVMNELIESWEEGAGVREFFILTAQSSEAHLEALSAIRTDEAKVQVIDIFSLDFGNLLERPSPIQGGELDTSLLLFLAPQLVRMELAQDFAPAPSLLSRYRPGQSRHLPAGSPGSVGYPSLASAQKGESLYRFILDRVSSCLVKS